MRFVKKIIALLAAVLFALFAISSCSGLPGFDDYDFDLNDFDYDDQWILGNTLENVRERYGEFDTEWTVPYQRAGYHLGFGRPADMDGVFRVFTTIWITMATGSSLKCM